ncbi:hypothetical protein ACP275_05G139400 [Erythranthe tilingii]
MERSVIKVVLLHIILTSYGVRSVRGSYKHRNILEEQQPNQEQPYRTGFHFQPPKNWMNDPNGPMYYNGVYHLFYQYNPYAAIWGNISWAHSVSYNLIDWIHLEPAIIPSEPYDIKGCWSGSATILPPEKKPVILYTGDTFSGQQVQNLATPKNLSDPFLIEWVKSPHNPLMVPYNDINPNFFRDPTTAWRKSDNKTWCVIVGNQNSDGFGAAILYTSDDFVSWRRSDKPFHFSKKTKMWECPDFYPVINGEKNGVDTSVVNGVGVRHVLKASFNDHDYYVIGKYDEKGDGFSVLDDVDFMDDEVQLRYDYGLFYASKTFYDEAKKLRVLWGWVAEADSQSDDVGKGWSGLQSMPRSILLDKNGKRLIQWPIEEVEKLRGKKVALENKELTSGTLFEISGLTASQADVEVSFRLPNLKGVDSIDEKSFDPQLLCRQMDASVKGVFGPFGLLVFASEDLTEKTAVFFRILQRNEKYVVLMCSDQSRSSLKTHVKDAIFGSFLDVDPNREISLRTLIDHSIVESFGGKGKSCITARVYPKLAVFENSHIYAFNNGTTSVTISRLGGWSMKKAQIAELHKRRKPTFT